MRAALIALLLMFGSQAGAASMGEKKSEEILLYGEIINFTVALNGVRTIYNVRYKKRFYSCGQHNFFMNNINGYHPYIDIHCIDNTKIKFESED